MDGNDGRSRTSKEAGIYIRNWFRSGWTLWQKYKSRHLYELILQWMEMMAEVQVKAFI